MRAVTEADAKAAAVQQYQAKAKRVEAWGKAIGTVATGAILAETAVLEALAIVLCIKAIRR
jgi:hypothetical protein